MYFIGKIIIVSCIASSLIACTSMRQNKQLRNQYLNSFIGQSSEAIQQNFNIEAINIHATMQKQLSNQKFIIKYEREIHTPVPTPMIVAFQVGNREVSSTQSGSIANAERTMAPCYIIYDLENNIAKSYHLKGRAC